MSLLNNILNDPWAIDRMSAMAYTPFVQKLIEGENASIHLPQQQEVSVSYMKTESFGPSNSTQHGKRIAIMNIKGVMMKDDGMCSAGMESMDNRLRSILADSSVGGVLFYIDSPGGEASYTLNFAKTIAEADKPTLTYTNRLMASAGYWLGSSADEVYASSENDQIGSIGTMVSFQDFRGVFDKMGIKTIDLYADGSEEKNDRLKLFQEGTPEALATLRKEWLNPINKTFHDSVKKNRKDISAEAMKGKVYYAKQAIDLGLIDGIKSMEECIIRLEEMISEQNNPELTPQINSSMNKNIQAVANFLGYEELASKDGHISLSNEDMAKIGEKLEAKPAESSAENSTEEDNPQLEAINKQLQEEVAKNVELNASLTAFEARVEALETNKPAAASASATVPASTETDPNAQASVDPWDDPNDPINQATQQRLNR